VLVGGGGTAHAADNVWLSCDRVSGEGTVKPGLSATDQLQTISVKNPAVAVAGQYPRTCTGALAATTGAMTAVKGKLVGVASCNPTPPPTPNADPVDGKLDVTWANFVNGKQLKSSSYIRLGAGATLDTFGLSNGIVTKGPGAGYDVKGDLLQAPVVTKKAPVGSVYSSLDSNGNIVFGQSSQDLGFACLLGVPTGTPAQVGPLTSVIFSTDGTSLVDGTTVVNSALTFTTPGS
jgi:hypothetical protein